VRLADLYPVALLAELSPVALLADLYPVALLADLSPVALLADLSPVALLADLYPVALLAELYPVALLAELYPVALLAELYPVALLADLSPVALLADLSPVALLADLSPVALLADLYPGGAARRSVPGGAARRSVPGGAARRSVPGGAARRAVFLYMRRFRWVAALQRIFKSRRDQRRDGERSLDGDFLRAALGVAIGLVLHIFHCDLGKLPGRVVVREDVQGVFAGVKAGFAEIGLRFFVGLADLKLKAQALPVLVESLVRLEWFHVSPSGWFPRSSTLRWFGFLGRFLFHKIHLASVLLALVA
jgi:hypothetical protein